jgi:hypothetical protein
MNSLGFLAPILPGQADNFRRFAKEVAGPRRKEMHESRNNCGVTRETTWLQSTPMGDLLVVYLEAGDVAKANGSFAASQAPFDRWFKETLLPVTGVDFGQPLPAGLAEPLFETPMVAAKASLAVALPIVPGKTDDLRRWAKDQAGVNRDKFMDFMHRAGIARACLYLVHTPQGDLAVQYTEADNPGAAYQYFATSTHPFDQSNREQFAAMHGLDFSKPFPGLPEAGYDYQNPDLSTELRAGTRSERRTDQGTYAPPA